MSQTPQLNRRWCSSGHHPYAKACGCSQAAQHVASPPADVDPDQVEVYPPRLGPWHLDAACRYSTTGLHFEGDVSDMLTGTRKIRARALCDGCPVRVECLIDALRTPKYLDYHMRGGLSRGERDEIRHGQVVLA